MTAAIPNVLTATRLVAVPLLVVLMIADGGDDGALRWWAVAVFVAAAATDYLDGFLARRWHVVSSFGKLADPIADKALVLTGLVMLVVIDGIPWWPVAVLAARELAVTVGRLAVADRAVIAASRGGKAKTVLQLAAITFYLVPLGGDALDLVAWWTLVAAVVVALVTGLDYGARIARAARTPRLTDEAGGDPIDAGSADVQG